MMVRSLPCSYLEVRINMQREIRMDLAYSWHDEENQGEGRVSDVKGRRDLDIKVQRARSRSDWVLV